MSIGALNGATTIRKPVVRGKIANLSSEQRDAIHQWFRENLTYAQIKERIKSEFGITIAASTLSVYYSQVSSEIFENTVAHGKVFDAEIVLRIRIDPEVRSITLADRKAEQ